MAKILEIFWKIFFENCTTVYKASFSKLDDLYNLVTKIITKYPVLTTFKISKNKENKSPIFRKKFEERSDENFFQKYWRCFFYCF